MSRLDIFNALVAGTFALLLHYADDEDHARRAWEHMKSWPPREGWDQVDDVKRAVAETRLRS